MSQENFGHDFDYEMAVEADTLGWQKEQAARNQAETRGIPKFAARKQGARKRGPELAQLPRRKPLPPFGSRLIKELERSDLGELRRSIYDDAYVSQLSVLAAL